MVRVTFVSLLMCVAAAAHAADDGQVRYLESEVRELKRQVMALTRRVDDATTHPDRLISRPASRTDAASGDASTTWLDAARWRKVSTGMSELEIVSLLGPPTSMRNVDGDRVLFYAMEIGASGFLGGSVKFRDRAVREIQVPVLQ
ncbi:MAG TPA: hypothetical protein VM146_08935 [Steroidobacteraceae bacterium]|nr:hypothetical protein [Steroidobacteraceae bacterium]